MKTEQERFEDVLDMVRILHKGKNGMYGSSFESLLNDEGLIAGFIPIANKFHRIREIKNLLGNDHKGIPSEKDEALLSALEDSALDIGVYGLKLYTWLQSQKRIKVTPAKIATNVIEAINISPISNEDLDNKEDKK